MHLCRYHVITPKSTTLAYCVRYSKLVCEYRRISSLLGISELSCPRSAQNVSGLSRRETHSNSKLDFSYFRFDFSYVVVVNK